MGSFFVRYLFRRLSDEFAGVPPSARVRNSGGSGPGCSGCRCVGGNVCGLYRGSISLRRLTGVLGGGVGRDGVPGACMLCGMAGGEGVVVCGSGDFRAGLVKTVGSRVVPAEVGNTRNVRVRFMGPFTLCFRRLKLLILVDFVLYFLTFMYIVGRMTVVQARRRGTEVRGSFDCTVVRSVGAPLTAVDVNVGTLAIPAIKRGRRLEAGCLAIVEGRGGRLCRLVGEVLAVSGFRSNGLVLGGAVFGLRRLLGGVRNGFRMRAGGRIAFGGFVGRLLIFTSGRCLNRIFCGLVSGSVGCSDGSIRVRVFSCEMRGKMGVHIGSGNVNVSGRSRRVVFSGFRQTSTSGHAFSGKKTPKFKLNLGCMLRIVRTRNNVISMSDRLNGCARFAVFLPSRGSDCKGAGGG